MDERIAGALRSEMAFEVRTRLAQFRPDTDSVADAEPLTDEMGQCDILRRDIPPVIARSERDVVVAFDCSQFRLR